VQARVRGQTLRGVVNIGSRPTLQSAVPQVRVEAHLLDFQDDVYGEEMEITFRRKLRDEKQFPSLAALQGQITRDIAEARLSF
jgi:riboflavin kinase/FMN adenylyltransferase